MKVVKHNALSGHTVTPPLGARARANDRGTIPPLSVWPRGAPGRERERERERERGGVGGQWGEASHSE